MGAGVVVVGGDPVVGVGHGQQVVVGVIGELGQPRGDVGDLGQAEIGGRVGRVGAVLEAD